MARRTKTSAKSSKIMLPNMKDVETRTTVPEGQYDVTVAGLEQKEGQNAPYLEWKLKIADGKFEGSTLRYITSLSENSLWNLRSMLECLEVEIPEEDDTELDPSDVVGLPLTVTVEHETYEGRTQARVVDFQPAEEEKPKKKTSAKKDEEDEKPARKTRAEKRAEKRRGQKDEDEEDEKPARGKKAAAKEAEVSVDDVMDMDDDELADLVAEHDVEIDLEEFATLRKRKNAVIDALEEAGVLAR